MGQPALKKVLFGFFHPDNVHPGYNDETCYEQVRVEGSTFGRKILHCKDSRNFSPWSVIERYEAPSKTEAIDYDLYMMFGLGEDFLMVGAEL